MNRSKKSQIDLGLAISRASLKPGQRRSHRELAAFCGVYINAICCIEEKALKKLRKRITFTREELALFR